MNASVASNAPGLVAYWQFDDGTGSNVLADAAQGSHDGTLTNMDANTNWNAGQVCCNSSAVPTLSQWGLIILGLTLLCLGAIAIHRQSFRKAEA